MSSVNDRSRSLTVELAVIILVCERWQWRGLAGLGAASLFNYLYVAFVARRKLDTARLTPAFSINCVSSCLPGGRSECECWRCRGVEQSEEDPEWAAKARSISTAFHDEQFKFLRGAR